MSRVMGTVRVCFSFAFPAEGFRADPRIRLAKSPSQREPFQPQAATLADAPSLPFPCWTNS